MKTEKLTANYYFTREYEKKSETEFYCKITMKKRSDDSVVTSASNSIDILETEQNIIDSEFSIAKVTWEDFLNETIVMLFNVLMFRINLEDIENITKDSISSFFEENPFHE